MSAKPGRNDPCTCGSGKKYKKCCMNKEEPPEPLGLRPPPPVPAYAAPVGRHETDYLKDRKTDQKPPRTEFDDWYDVYEAGSPDHKMEMIRDLLSQDRPAEYFKDNDFGGILLDLHGEFPKGEEGKWISLIEHIHDARPDVFNLDIENWVNELAYHYVASGRLAVVNDLVEELVARALPPTALTFELLDVLHLAGLHQAARMLVTDAVTRIDQADLFEWAADELVTTATFFPFHDLVEAGCTDDRLVRLKEELAALESTPAPDRLDQLIAHRSGRADRQFTWDDFESENDPESFNLVLLSLDFGRWLTTERGMPPITAEAMRRFLAECLLTVSEKKGGHPLELPSSAIERHLIGMFSPVSLQQTRAIATMIALHHVTEFLRTRGLIDQKRYEDRSAFWDKQWSDLCPVLLQKRRDHSFLMRWW
jgi:hypothetical protein